jgi:hypothetical protein
MRIIAKNFILYFIIFSLAIGDFLLYMGILSMFFKWDETLIVGLLGFTGAIIGGSLTLIGVKWSISRQDEEKFRDEFPNKIVNLDTLIDTLSDLYNVDKEAFLLNAIRNSHINEEPIMRDIFNNLIRYSVNVDGIVYKKINSIREFYYLELKSIKKIRNYKVVGYDSMDRPITKPTEEAAKEIAKTTEIVIQKFNDLINELKKHKSKMENRYFN